MTSSAADLADQSASTGVPQVSVGWLAVGRVSAVAAAVLCVVLQAINHDFFPPQISVSQYGVGPRGWVFTLWTVVTAVAALTLHAGEPANGHRIGYWLAIGSIGLVVMGVVRTDAGGLQQSWHAKVHMYGSILALVALPIGMAMAMNWAHVWWRRVAWVLVVFSAIALVMVLFSASGVALPGLDAQHSWALWQAVAVTVDMILLVSFAVASFYGREDEVSGSA